MIILFPTGRDVGGRMKPSENESQMERADEDLQPTDSPTWQYDESVINVREHSAILIIFLLKIEENTTWDIWYKLK